VGVRLAVAAIALALAASPADYVASHQQPDGGFAEPNGRSDPALTAWAALGLVAVGRQPSRSTVDYLASQSSSGAGDLALRIIALRALGQDTATDEQRLAGLRKPDGRIGPLVNSTIWGILALRSAGRPVGPSVHYLLRAQQRNGGWSWYPRGLTDSNDTAAAVQALRASGISSRSSSIRRALAYLSRLEQRDGGFALVSGRGSDAQSTAWAIQAYVAAGRPPARAAFRYLAGLRRADGSYRYSKSHVSTPVWVTAQVLPALARRSFPLVSLAGWPPASRRRSSRLGTSSSPATR
jgi:energy-coupling factor transport system substrate-specific component